MNIRSACNIPYLLGTPNTNPVVRTLDIYPYPELPAYNGSGNPDVASSYHGQVSLAVQQPTPWLGKFDSTTMWCSSQGTDCYETNNNPPWSPWYRHRV